MIVMYSNRTPSRPFESSQKYNRDEYMYFYYSDEDDVFQDVDPARVKMNHPEMTWQIG